MKRYTVYLMALLFAATMFVGLPKEASAFDLFGNKAVTKTVIDTAKQTKAEVKAANRANDKKIAELKRDVDAFRAETNAKIASATANIASAETACADCGNKGKKAPPRRAAKKSPAPKPVAPKVTFPEGNMGKVITDQTNYSLMTLAEARWAKTLDGRAVAEYCLIEYDGKNGVSYKDAKEQFVEKCIHYVWTKLRENPNLDAQTFAAAVSVQDFITSDGGKTRTVVVAEGTETRTAIASSTVELKAAIFSEKEMDKANMFADRVWSSFAALQTDRTSAALQDQFCASVANNISVIQSDNGVYTYYNPGYVDFLVKNNATCASPVPAKKKKFHLGPFQFLADAVNFVSKATIKQFTHGVCLNTISGGKCEFNLGRAALGGFSTVVLAKAVLSPWALDHLGLENRPPAVSSNGGGGGNTDTSGLTGPNAYNPTGGPITNTNVGGIDANTPNAGNLPPAPNTIGVPGGISSPGIQWPTGYQAQAGGAGTTLSGPQMPAATRLQQTEVARRAERFGSAF